MAGTQRHPALDLIAELKRCPGQFPFFQALRILSRTHLPPDSGSPPGLPAGLRLGHRMGSDFPTGDFGAWVASGPDGTDRLELACLGLAGPGSPLPTAWIEALLEAPEMEGLQPLLDGFTHRLGLLCLDAWRSARPWAQAEIRAPGGVMAHLADLSGPAWSLPDPSLAGLLLRRPIPGEAILALTRATLGVPVKAESFFPAWRALPAQHRARLGAATAALTGTTPLGSRWMDRQGSLRLHLGPMPFPALRDLLAGGRHYAKLIKISSQNNLLQHLDLVIHLDTRGLPRLRLGTQAPGQGLGQCASISRKPGTQTPGIVQLRGKSMTP